MTGKSLGSSLGGWRCCLRVVCGDWLVVAPVPLPTAPAAAFWMQRAFGALLQQPLSLLQQPLSLLQLLLELLLLLRLQLPHKTLQLRL